MPQTEGFSCCSWHLAYLEKHQAFICSKFVNCSLPHGLVSQRHIGIFPRKEDNPFGSVYLQKIFVVDAEYPVVSFVRARQIIIIGVLYCKILHEWGIQYSPTVLFNWTSERNKLCTARLLTSHPKLLLSSSPSLSSSLCKTPHGGILNKLQIPT